MYYQREDLNSIWCAGCNKIMSQCICKYTESIYLVDYKLLIKDILAFFYQRARCIAYDNFMAMLVINDWLKTTNSIWTHTGEEISIPNGPRDITILHVEVYAEDVGDLLKQYPLPEVFPCE